ncbi:MAG: extracellular catalytic domain type 2 short-chain-length polyhydroxyalkanoate depolymerase [Hyphomicrobium sp.]
MTRAPIHRTRAANGFAFASAVGFAWLAACSPEPMLQLPALQANVGETSVSGISSGAYMAGQFEFAHSDLVSGAAIIAGGPYGCAESAFADAIPGPGAAFLNLSKAINGCMLNALMIFGVPNTPMLIQKAERRAADGRIGALSDVRSDRVYLFTGKEDRTVVPPIVRAAAEFYEAVGVPKASIKLVESYAAGHAFVTEDEGLACEATGKPFVVDCDYDQAGDLLAHIYGRLQAKAAKATGTFMVFDQALFTRDLGDHGLSDRGVAYVPKSCATGETCRIHIAFHGCSQNRATVGEAFVTETGFARWADTNKLIVLFPQTATTPLNPQGCWDWWGYTGHDYLTQSAPQIVAVHRMLKQLGAARPSF